MPEIDRDKVRKDFAEAVNMTASELKDWLDSRESKSVGWKGKDGKGRAKASATPAAGRLSPSLARRRQS